jgi:hypothetical protein
MDSQVKNVKINLFLISIKYVLIYFHIKENSSVGRTLVSKTKSQGFNSSFSCFCQRQHYRDNLKTDLFFFLH